MDSENFKKDITEADLPNSPRHHPCYRKGENPQQSRKLNHTLWSTIDIPTTLQPHPFSKPPRTSISGKRKPSSFSWQLHFLLFSSCKIATTFFVCCRFSLHPCAPSGSVRRNKCAHNRSGAPAAAAAAFVFTPCFRRFHCSYLKSHGFYANQPRESSQF